MSCKELNVNVLLLLLYVKKSLNPDKKNVDLY